LVAHETLGRPQSPIDDAATDAAWMAALLREKPENGDAIFELASTLRFTMKTKDAAQRKALFAYVANTTSASVGRSTLMKSAGNQAVNDADLMTLLVTIVRNDSDDKLVRRSAVRELGKAARKEA
jgi:hypothetical protein